jgi:hypothetical protein
MKLKVVSAGLAAIALSGCAADGGREVYRPYQAAAPVYVEPAPPVYVQPVRPIIIEPGPVYAPGRPYYWHRPPPRPGYPPPYYGRPDRPPPPGRPGPRCPPDLRFGGRSCVP